MSLKLYREKRKFEDTSEPKGKQKSTEKGLIFVVQKHAARRLHYDFRLELYGVLKSWAIPKGPSLDPTIKRLAIEVEDHPIEYASFEGTIPKGNYGAGTVEIWDQGTYEVVGKGKREQQKNIAQQLEAGELKFTLFGEKLQGEFTLVKLKGSENEKHWLLIKKKDLYPNQASQNNESFAHLTEDIPKSKIPHQIKPMLCYLIDQPFDDPDWIFENKWDGYRAIAEIEKGKVLLYSRNFLSFNASFPALIKDLEKFKKNIVFDGEVVVMDKEGRPHFQLLQNYMQERKRLEGALKYCIFDLLYYEGHDLRQLPLIQRKQLLKSILEEFNLPSLYYSDHIERDGAALFQAAEKHHLEGIIAKEALSPYLSTRSKHWLKIKTHKRQEVVIAGFTAPKRSRKLFGALMVGVYENNTLIYTGNVGGGFNHHSLKEVYELLEPLITDNCPFKTRPKIYGKLTWVKPKIVCEVVFQEWTQEGYMRQPVFKGIRVDKAAAKVEKEKEHSVTVLKTRKKESKKIPLKEIITHPEKVFWPDEGYTKHDLLKYYEHIAPVILPYLKDRPMVLNRFPDGIEGKNFFQKEVPEFIPSWIETVQVQHTEKTITYMVISSVESLLYAVNLGSIELNPFLSRYPRIDYPDSLVIDIDPVSLPFESTIEVAQATHKVLDKLEIPSYCKTSGKRGLHIYIPLNGKYAYEVIENFAKLIAQTIHKELPNTTSLIRNPAKRQKKVYIDYLQNSPTKTVVAPYSVRPVEGATVSTPLEWKEVKKGLNPKAFTIETMPSRVKKKGDLFADILKGGFDIQSLNWDLFD